MYAGITNRLAERFAAHQAGKGAKFTRANPPMRILGAKQYADRSEASKAEYAIKKLPRGRKLAFLTASNRAEGCQREIPSPCSSPRAAAAQRAKGARRLRQPSGRDMADGR